MEYMLNKTCPCGKNKSFSQCCGQFILNNKDPKTPEQLMRSRYSAYALGGYGEYLLKTWFPVTAKGLTAQELSQRRVEWQKLEVIAKSQNGDEGTVEFKAHYLPLLAEGERQVLHEISEFKRINGHWYYVGGRVT